MKDYNMVQGLEKHPALERFLNKASKFLNEDESDEAVLNLRKAVEYIVDQYAVANSYDIHVELNEKIKTLSSNNIISNNVASIFHAIRLTGNDTGAHWSEELTDLEVATEYYQSIISIIPIFLGDFPCKIEVDDTWHDRMDINLNLIKPLEITRERDEIKKFYSEMEYYFYLVDYALNCGFALDGKEKNVVDTLTNYMSENYVVPDAYFYVGGCLDSSHYDFGTCTLPHIINRDLDKYKYYFTPNWISCEYDENSECDRYYIDLPKIAKRIVSAYKNWKNKETGYTSTICIPTLLKDVFDCQEITFDIYGNPTFIELQPSFAREYMLAQNLFTPEVVSLPSKYKEFNFIPKHTSVKMYYPSSFPKHKVPFLVFGRGVDPEIVTIDFNPRKVIIPPKFNVELIGQLLHESPDIEEIECRGLGNDYQFKNGFLISKDGETLYYALKNADPFEHPNGIKNLGPYAYAVYKFNDFEYNMPDTICRIERCAYKNLTSRYVFCSKTLSYIGEGAFTDCKDLVYVICEDKNALDIDKQAFINCKHFEGVITHEEYEKILADNNTNEAPQVINEVNNNLVTSIQQVACDSTPQKKHMRFSDLSAKEVHDLFELFVHDTVTRLQNEKIKLQVRIKQYESEDGEEAQSKANILKEVLSEIDSCIDEMNNFPQTNVVPSNLRTLLVETRNKNGYLTNYLDYELAISESNLESEVLARKNYYHYKKEILSYLSEKKANAICNKEVYDKDYNMLRSAYWAQTVSTKSAELNSSRKNGLAEVRCKYGFETNYADEIEIAVYKFRNRLVLQDEYFSLVNELSEYLSKKIDEVRHEIDSINSNKMLALFKKSDIGKFQEQYEILQNDNLIVDNILKSALYDTEDTRLTLNELINKYRL